MILTHDNECEWRLGHDCTCSKKDPRDAEIARLQAERNYAQDSLDAAKEEIARLQAEVEEWKGHAIKRAQERNTAFNRIETLQDERDTARNDALEEVKQAYLHYLDNDNNVSCFEGILERMKRT